MLYGHVHKEYGDFRRETVHESGTKLVNCWQSHIMTIGEEEHPAVGKTGSALYDLYMSIRMRSTKMYW